LRKYGVRFGAYHLYLPVLLKPAPRRLAAQLWALRHAQSQAETPNKGLDDVLHLAGSGRTSIPVDRDIDATLYRTAGYRVCGERALRVDILERLADLIRPALSWREGGTGVKPAGAFAGGGFTVVNSMTSLTGASGEDFASILRALGYRMERRPKPPEPPQAETPSFPTVEGSGVEVESTLATPESEATLENAEQPAVATDAAELGSAAEDSPAGSHDDVKPGPIGEDGSLAEPAADPVAAESVPAEAVVSGGDAEAVAAAEPAPVLLAEEPLLIEVWRPGRREGRPEGRRRPRPERQGAARDVRRGRGGETPAPRPDETAAMAAPADDATTVPATEPLPGAAAEPAKETRHPRHRRRHGGERHGGERHAGERHGSERHSAEKHGGEHRSERPQRERERVAARPARFERREKAPDPNSPFAKLAALKAQLEANAKERG
jgi:ATP-dependent RNA helicase SUPV3L1/SUV3